MVGNARSKTLGLCVSTVMVMACPSSATVIAAPSHTIVRLPCPAALWMPHREGRPPGCGGPQLQPPRRRTRLHPLRRLHSGHAAPPLGDPGATHSSGVLFDAPPSR